MKMKWKKVIGIVLLCLGTFFFLLDFIRLRSILAYILTFLAFISPVLSGKKVAMYIHDTALAKEKGFNANAMSFVYLWLFFWLFILIIYTIVNILFGESINLVVSVFTSYYFVLIYTPLLFVGAFYLYQAKYASNKSFLTFWGKNVEKSKRVSKNVVEKVKESTRYFEKYL